MKEWRIEWKGNEEIINFFLIVLLSSSDTIANIQSYAKPLYWYQLILSFSDQWVNSPYSLLAMLNAGVFGLLLPIYMAGLHGTHLDQLRPGEGRDLAIRYYTLP